MFTGLAMLGPGANAPFPGRDRHNNPRDKDYSPAG
jgi:hypothetical protein